MKTSICHYSYHRVFAGENWSLEKLVGVVKEQGVDGIDFHAKFLPSSEEAPAAITAAMEGSGLELSGLSLSTNFNQADDEQFRAQVDSAKQWLKAAGAVKAPVSRVFGGSLKDRSDENIKAGLDRVVRALNELVPVAEEQGVVLALENHGGLPCSGEEQVSVIEKINSPYLRATVDVGNYMAFPQEGHEGTAQAAKYCAYVHLKDMSPVQENGRRRGVVIGRGEVDIPRCLKILKDSGYDGFVALEYEDQQVDELDGVAESVTYMKKAIAEL